MTAHEIVDLPDVGMRPADGKLPWMCRTCNEYFWSGPFYAMRQDKAAHERGELRGPVPVDR